jgi:hypothetical protein
MRESKLDALSRLLARLARLGEPAIVFTEYRDTLLHVQRTLERSHRLVAGPGALGILHGGLTREERRRALDGFRSGGQRVLLATDAGGEGLNLHHGCRVVVNLELPWNPMRLEQRIGRVDRIGQRHRVHAFNLILSDSGEARILDRLKARIERARQDIGVPDPLSSSTDDESSFRTIVGDPEEDGRVYDPPPCATEPLTRLTVEADSECRRLVRAREWTGRANPRDSLRPVEPAALDFDTLVAYAANPVTRARLSPRSLIVFHSTLEDGCGRVIASRMSPLAVLFRERVARDRARSIDVAIARTLEVWRPPELLADLYLSFWRTRIRRERAIAELLSSAPGAMPQPGLFDRRAERDAAARIELGQDAAARLAALEGGFCIGRPRHRAALFLIP